MERWLSIQERLDTQIDSLRAIAKEANAVKKRLRDLGSSSLTFSDTSKVSALSSKSQELLEKFGFSSMKASEIGLSDDDFRPRVLTEIDESGLELRDIGFEASASDGIRLKWAYHLAIMSVAQTYAINHLGFLVFDEPGQQQMKEVDLHEMLSWCAQNVCKEFQVIVTTSQDRRKIRAAVKDCEVVLHEFDGFILSPIT